jgi:hypothetical protein
VLTSGGAREATTGVSLDGATTWTSIGTLTPASDLLLRYEINLRGNGVAFRFTPNASCTRLELRGAKVGSQPKSKRSAV